MQKIINKTNKNNYVILLAFFIPFLICLLICIGKGVYPFGVNCILTGDLAEQYYPFFVEFYNKIHGGGSFMYSWNVGLGSDFIGLYAYYLASPLNWLLFLCPESLIIEFMTLLILVKIAMAGLFFYIFLKNIYELKDLQSYIAVVFSTAYAMCGFISAYSISIMWLDGMAFAPLIILGLRKLVMEQKAALYYISLSVCILANYYLGMIVCIFLVFYFLLLLFEQKEERLKCILRFIVYSLLAGGTGAILLFPEIKALGYSNTYGNEFPHVIEWYFNILTEIGRMCTLSKGYLGGMHLPNLYTGAFSILLISLYIFNKNITLKEKIPRLAMLVFFMLSFSCNYLDYLWHGLRFPTDLPGRQSFLFSFMILSIGFKAIIELEGMTSWKVFDSLVVSSIVLVIGALTTNHDTMPPEAFWVSGLFIFIYAVLVFVYKSSRIENKKIIVIIACVFALVELTMNMAVTGFRVTERKEHTAKLNDYKEILRLADKDAKGQFYRLEATGRRTENDSALYGYAGASIFSSLSNINVSYFNEKVFMECGGNYYGYHGATPLTSAMLSVNYLVADSPDYQDDFRLLIGQSGDLYLYKNTYQLPMGYIMSEEAIKKVEETDEIKLGGLNVLAESLSAESNYLALANCNVVADNGCTNIYVKEDGYYYTFYDICMEPELVVESVAGGKRFISDTTHPYLIDLGYHKAGEEIWITNANQQKIGFEVYKLNPDVFFKAYDSLNEQTLTTLEVNDTCIRGIIDVYNAGRLILPIVKEDGWSLYVDGVKQPGKDFADTFISVYLEKGKHGIELRYSTPFLFEGGLISGICIVISVILLFLRERSCRRIN